MNPDDLDPQRYELWANACRIASGLCARTRQDMTPPVVKNIAHDSVDIALAVMLEVSEASK